MKNGKDSCEVCLGTRKGVPGNENIINEVVMCDYCSVLQEKEYKMPEIGKKEYEIGKLSDLLPITIVFLLFLFLLILIL